MRYNHAVVTGMLGVLFAFATVYGAVAMIGFANLVGFFCAVLAYKAVQNIWAVRLALKLAK